MSIYAFKQPREAPYRPLSSQEELLELHRPIRIHSQYWQYVLVVLLLLTSSTTRTSFAEECSMRGWKVGDDNSSAFFLRTERILGELMSLGRNNGLM